MIEIDIRQKNHQAEKQFIDTLLSYHLQEGHAIGIWQLPYTNKKNIMVGTEGVQSLTEVALEELGSGFIIAPFDGDKNKFFIKANETYVLENGECSSSQNSSMVFAENSRKSKLPAIAPLSFHRPHQPAGHEIGRQEYLDLVAKTLLHIADGKLEKLVPARNKRVVLPPHFDLIQTFIQLCLHYPNAFVSLVSSPETGTWLGVSPELLVHLQGDRIFKTVAVAGTQRYLSNTDLKTVAWTEKEIEEQALVSRYIINCFKKIRLREFEEHGPKTWRAGDILHLKTEFEVDRIATNFPQLGSVMLKLLHPTSAVCGMPREASIQFLQENESFDRQFYSGYLGPINYQNESHIYVNLRCMQWIKQEAILYAGAGVTLDSTPEREWEETELKLNTLLKVINSKS